MTNKAFLYLFNTVIIFSSIFLVSSIFAGSVVGFIGFIINITLSIFMRAMIKADIDEDEERSKQHGGIK